MLLNVFVSISRLNQIGNDNTGEDTENVEGNHRKKREKKVKFYSSFEPIKGQISGTCEFILNTSF